MFLGEKVFRHNALSHEKEVAANSEQVKSISSMVL